MFVYIHHNRPFPWEQEVARASTCNYGDEKPSVVRHRYQHEQVADCHLKDVK